MTPLQLKQFSLLCESILHEDSTAISKFGKNPGATELFKYLHTKEKLADNLMFFGKAASDISWPSLKKRSVQTWVILLGKKGTAAISTGGSRWNSEYNVFIKDVNAASVENFTSATISDVLRTVKSKIGSVSGIFMASVPSEHPEKIRRRTTLAAPNTVSLDELLRKFRPTWEKALVAAMANVVSHGTDAFKNRAFEKAKKWAAKAEELQRSLDALEYDSDFGKDANADANRISREGLAKLKSALSLAVNMAAAHYYPEETGEIRRSYQSFNASAMAGPRQLLTDIANGDMQKLGTILYFFKGALVTA